MGLTRLEQETGVIWNEQEPEAIIWTTSPVQRRRFTRLFGQGVVRGTLCTEWSVPVVQLTIARRRKGISRPMTEAQKAALLGARLRKAEKGGAQV
jgi:hypothetical protein